MPQVMAAGMADYERRDDVRRMKRALFERIPADATVAEIGVGAGVNLAYYAPTARKIVAVEPNAAFFGPASSAAARLGLQQSSFELVEGVAEAMPLADDTVDAVVGTHVLCSVTDVRRTLEEVRRVLKPGGLYVFAEYVGSTDCRMDLTPLSEHRHVAAPREAAMLGMAQRMADPLQVCCAGGCHLRRDHAATLAAVFADPSDRLELHRFMLDGVGPAPPWPPHFLLAPHLCGVATKAGGERRRPTSVVSSLEAAITAANTA